MSRDWKRSGVDLAISKEMKKAEGSFPHDVP